MLGRLGSGLLSRALGRSIIAAGGFNGRVRDGIGWKAPAWAAKPTKHTVSMANRLSPASRWFANRLSPASCWFANRLSPASRDDLNNLVLELDPGAAFLILRSAR